MQSYSKYSKFETFQPLCQFSFNRNRFLLMTFLMNSTCGLLPRFDKGAIPHLATPVGLHSFAVKTQRGAVYKRSIVCLFYF